jgi:hypothetical protein
LRFRHYKLTCVVFFILCRQGKKAEVWRSRSRRAENK